MKLPKLHGRIYLYEGNNQDQSPKTLIFTFSSFHVKYCEVRILKGPLNMEINIIYFLNIKIFKVYNEKDWHLSILKLFFIDS